MKKRSRLLRSASLASLGVYGMGFVTLATWQRLAPLDLPPAPESPPAITVEQSAPNPTAWLVLPDRLRRRETLAALLQRNGFTPLQVHEVAEALSPHLNLRLLQAGDEVEILYASTGEVESVRVHRGALETYQARLADDVWVGDQLPIVIEQRQVERRGTLEGSLFASMERMGETAALVVVFAEVFAWDFDFYTQSRQGDQFSMLVEKLYRDGRFVGYGDLLAARYVSGKTDLSAFLYSTPEGKRGYYNADGKSMRKAFLKTPLKFQRISSRFSYSRRHPVHGRRRAHLGVDYAAPTGTPVHSVAAGKVIGISTKGGSGRMVTIRHSMGYQSKYLHLSRFAKGLRVGKRIEQKQVIGYVGSTGLATGPHLDFRLIRYGKPVNPLKQIFPPGPPVPEEYMPEFQRNVDRVALKLLLPTDGLRAAE